MISWDITARLLLVGDLGVKIGIRTRGVSLNTIFSGVTDVNTMQCNRLVPFVTPLMTTWVYLLKDDVISKITSTKIFSTI